MNLKSTIHATALLSLCGFLSGLEASTVAYWRFEEGPVDTNVLKPGGVADGQDFAPSIQDSSGNNNHLSVWSVGGGAGYAYRADPAGAVVAQTGAANTFSVQNTGGGPALFTQTGGALQTWQPGAFTIEAAIKPENNGWRTFIGRDSRGAFAGNGDLAAMYFQVTPQNGLAFKFVDMDGNFHDATSADNVVQSFAFPNSQGIPWQYVAAVSDGSSLKVYLDSGSGYTQVAQVADLGTGNTALSAGTGDGGDWDAGNFTVGRGLYAGNHGDRAYGLLDEVRFSDTALAPTQFLNAVPEPASALLLIPGLGMFLRRRR